MEPKSIYGYVNGDRSIKSGSGDFTVGEMVETGVYSIILDTPFEDIPAVTGTVLRDDLDYLSCLQVKQVGTGQFTLVMMETENHERKDESFFFTAIGPSDDS